MHRELNSELFGVKTLHEEAPLGVSLGLNNPKTQETFGLQTTSGNRIPAPVALEMKSLEAQILQLRMQVQATDKKNEQLMSQMQELVRAANSRFDRAGQAINRLESSANTQIQELSAKYAGVASKVNERKVQEVKVQEMIDRHNSIVRAFENRLTHMQRVMTEQEMQLHNYAAALEEARQDLARLKQMPRTPDRSV
jgi:chromosome segregation ATPase